MLFSQLEVFADRQLRNGAAQMATDELLLQRASLPILRHYVWSSPQATFGYTQSFAEVRKEIPTLPLTRRWTGGGIVPHGSDWTFSLIIPREDGFAAVRPSLSYTRIHECLRHAMNRAGLSSRLASAEDSSIGISCFTHPAEHDLLAPSGLKLCGGAQRRTREGILHQGSVQQAQIPDDFLNLLAETLSSSPRPLGNPPSEDEIQALAQEKYVTTEWLHRRA